MINENESKAKLPTQAVYYVVEKDTEKPDLIKTWVAWENGYSKGLNFSLEIMGQKVSSTVRKNKPKAE